MLRLTGGIMILMGTLGMGIWYRQRMYTRIEIIAVFIHILENFKSEVNFGEYTLPESCRNISRRLSKDSGLENRMRAALENVYDRMQSDGGECFSKVLQREVWEELSDFEPDKRDVEIFSGFADNSGVNDKSLQLKLLDLSINRLMEQEERQKKEAVDKGRISVGLGMLSGMLLVILLI